MALKAKPFRIEWSRPGGDTKQIDTDLKEQLFRIDQMFDQLFTGVKNTQSSPTLSDTDLSHTLSLVANENLSANRTLNFVTGDADRTLTLTADASIPQTTISGNAATATALQTARTINGTSFDGTANITVTADASTLTNTTLASGVVTSSLTTLGTAVDLRTSTSNFGYRTGAGGTATQSTSKATAVTINEACGEITMNNANLAAGAVVSFTFNNNTITQFDILVVAHTSVGTLGAYLITAATSAGSATIYVTNISAGDLAEAIHLRFALIKGVDT